MSDNVAISRKLSYKVDILMKSLLEQMMSIFRTNSHHKNKINLNKEYFASLISFINKFKSIPLLMVLVIPAPIWAGEYFVIDTADTDTHWDQDALDLCSLITDNFNHYADEPPMVCVRKFQPDLKEITFPQWTAMDSEDFKQLLIEAKAENEFLDGGFLGFVKTINILTEQGREFGTWISRFDMNSDGSIDEVYRFTAPKLDFQCKDEDGNQGEHEGGFRSHYFLKKESDKDEGLILARPTILFGDIFFYRNKTYFHQWRNGYVLHSEEAMSYESPFPRIVIRRGITYRGAAITSEAVCEIGYQSTKHGVKK